MTTTVTENLEEILVVRPPGCEMVYCDTEQQCGKPAAWVGAFTCGCKVARCLACDECKVIWEKQHENGRFRCTVCRGPILRYRWYPA